MKEPEAYKLEVQKPGVSTLTMYVPSSNARQVARSLREEGADVTMTPISLEEIPEDAKGDEDAE